MRQSMSIGKEEDYADMSIGKEEDDADDATPSSRLTTTADEGDELERGDNDAIDEAEDTGDKDDAKRDNEETDEADDKLEAERDRGCNDKTDWDDRAGDLQKEIRRCMTKMLFPS
eukprot:g1502.t1